MANVNNSHPPADAATIQILGQIKPCPGPWQPRAGSEVLKMLRLPSLVRLVDESKLTILQEATNTLSRCIPPTRLEGRETGLVIGYVQSGKTMSFTTVAALAHDNGYRLVIIIAGSSTYLTDQSRKRLVNDLRISDASEFRPWRHVTDPSLANNSHHVIRDVLAEWNDPTVPQDELRTVLITVMKHHGYLQNLIDVLRAVDLNHVPCLIIDDEGDQAGLNTRVRAGGDPSTTYSRLLSLKDSLPHHTYLQYTATPQAPLLISLVDVLSPKFAEILTPGPDYVGGREVFYSGSNWVRIIPQSDLPTQRNHLMNPPESLLQAMKFFFVGAAAHLEQKNAPLHRSMMVHPSQLTDRHGQYLDWVLHAREGWMRILEEPETSSERKDLIHLFQLEHSNILATEPSAPKFDALQPRLLHAMRRTTVRPLNSRPEGRSQVDWSQNPYWILVGGQSLDRGFTVEGLTVTYMPRGPGVGNADTIQQRARFLGYKRSYMGYCRVFLERDVAEAFHAYVEHEEDIRAQLIAHRDTGRPMAEWRRQFFLASTLRPTRPNVFDIDYTRILFRNDWVIPHGPHDSAEAVQENLELFKNFLSTLPFVKHEGLDRRLSERENLIAKGVPLRIVHEDFLTRFRVSRIEDSRQFSGLLRLVQVHLINNPSANCSVFLMSSGQPTRRAYVDNRIEQLFQGPSVNYPGDKAIKIEDELSVQVRIMDLGKKKPFIATNIPHIAVWVPASMSRDLVDQPQGG